MTFQFSLHIRIASLCPAETIFHSRNSYFAAVFVPSFFVAFILKRNIYCLLYYRATGLGRRDGFFAGSKKKTADE